MEKYQKESILFALATMEKRITETKETIAKEVSEDLFGWTAAESIAAYASRLNGYIQERRGYCYALNNLGYRVKWDGNHAVDIEEVEV